MATAPSRRRGRGAYRAADPVSGAEGGAEEGDVVAVEHVVRAGLEDNAAVVEVAHQPADVVEDDADAWHHGAVVQPDGPAGARDEVEEADAVGGILDAPAGGEVGDHTLVVELDLD